MWVNHVYSFDTNKNISILNNKIISLQKNPIIKDNIIYLSVETLSELLQFKTEFSQKLNSIRFNTSSMALPLTELEKDFEKNKKVAYLTFDDGVDKQVTPKILDILSKYNLKATFFVIGNTIKSNENILKRIADEGHEIGNHTYSHKKEIIYTNVDNFKKEIDLTTSLIKAVTGQNVLLFRPPYGSKVIRNKDYKEYLKDYKTVLWNVDSMDSRVRGINSDEIAKKVIASLHNKKSAIILFHIGANHEQTALALPKIIDYLMNNNFLIEVIKSDTKLNYQY